MKVQTHMMELAGFADALKVSGEQILYYGMTYLVPRCSQMALLPSVTAEGKPLLARNYEFNHEMEDFCLMKTSVTGKYTHMATSVLRFGREDGVNEPGLAVTMSSCGFPVGPLPGMRAPGLKGLQYWAVIRGLLENCRDMEEGLTYLQEMPIAFNLNLVLMDKAGCAALVETIDGQAAVKRIGPDSEEQILYATNQAAGYSYYHLNRQFSAVLGESVGSYIKKRRLADAAKKLLYSDQKIIDIAMDNGFESPEAFSRAFKAVYRVSPQTYRKNRLDAFIGAKERLDKGLLNHLACNDNVIYAMDEDVIFTEVAGTEVSSFAGLPDGFVKKTLPGGRYAVFTHRGTLRMLRQTFDYSWGTWFLTTREEVDPREDFELYDERFLGYDHPDSEVDLYIPVK